MRDLLSDICSPRKLDFQSGPYGGREAIVTGELLVAILAAECQPGATGRR